MSTDRIAFDPLQCSDSLVRLMDYWSQQAVLSTGIPRLLIEQPKPVSQAEMMMRIDAAMVRMRDDLVRQCQHFALVVA